MLCMHNLKLFLKKTGTLSFFKESLLFITAICFYLGQRSSLGRSFGKDWWGSD